MEETPHMFLFADLVGFTALTDLEGDDRAAAVAVEFQRRARELAALHSSWRRLRTCPRSRSALEAKAA
jgi:hypothetical protein